MGRGFFSNCLGKWKCDVFDFEWWDGCDLFSFLILEIWCLSSPPSQTVSLSLKTYSHTHSHTHTHTHTHTQMPCMKRVVITNMIVFRRGDYTWHQPSVGGPRRAGQKPSPEHGREAVQHPWEPSADPACHSAHLWKDGHAGNHCTEMVVKMYFFVDV